MAKPINIFMVNYDWRDIFRQEHTMFVQKLDRDQLGPKLNNFFFFSWANQTYYEEKGNFKTLHQKTRIYKLKPILDLLAMIKIPAAAQKYDYKPNVWLTYDFGMLPALWLARKRYGGKIVLCVSNQPQVYSQTRKFGGIKKIYSWISERLWWRIADHFFTINENMRTYLVKIGIPKEKISVFYVNTIDRDLEFIAQARRGLTRSKYDIPSTSKIILSVARLESEKNVELLIDLFSKLSKEFVLMIVGEGSLQPKLQAQIEKLGIKDRVIFAGFIHRNEIWNYFADADVFVLLSRAEALGLVFWEAMHMNVPVVGSDADGIVETIGNDGDRGLLYGSKNQPEDFIRKIDFAVKPSSERLAMIDRAKQYVDLQRQNKLTFNDLYEKLQ